MIPKANWTCAPVEITPDKVLYKNPDGSVRDSYARDADWLAPYFTCRHCAKPVPEAVALNALREFQRGLCGDACWKAETKKRFACCERAEFKGCVCMYAFTCAVHGERHIGTHD